MAERSGLPALDAAIEAFLARGQWQVYAADEAGYVVRTRPLADLRRAEVALGQCIQLTEQFNRFLAERGIVAAEPWEDGRPACVIPEALGYADRLRGGLAQHYLTLVHEAGVTYSIDWTAAQYGYAEFPLVQRFQDGAWERKWVADALPASLERAA